MREREVDNGNDSESDFEERATDSDIGDSGREREEFELPLLDGNPIIFTRDQHTLSRRNIDPDCLKVLHRLIQHGHVAFLVGGGVRDILLGRAPKDFDVATDARPEDVRHLFRNSRIIGRRFRLNQVYFGSGKIIEVATFRAEGEVDAEGETAILQADNTYGTPQSDARRRDLTINGLFYDARSHAVIDYVGGMEDLKNGVVRIIGDPDRRFTEDPVRMIRAVRHAARVDFKIEEATWTSILKNGELIHHCARSRIHEELLKDLKSGHSRSAFLLLQDSGLLKHFMPQLSASLNDPEGRTAITEVFDRIDKGIRERRDFPVPVLFLAPHIHLFPSDTSADLDEIRDRVQEVFEDIGVTRREREGMEQTLALALRIFDATGNPGRARALAQKQIFSTAMQLIELTSTNEAGRECLEFWEDFRPTARSHHRPHHSRRRGRR